nr:hypothetical protein [uncultured Mediterranean phage uvMED]|tara:strand:+ start:610 stop:951 length:342 start_codon:yes stop_codon:yes gene_type:complete
MKHSKLETEILNIFEELESDIQQELQLEGLSAVYNKVAKFLLKQVKAGKFLRDYDISPQDGRMVFRTGSGKKIIFKDMKLGVTANKTWKGKKDSEFFDYNDHQKMLKFALADI